jgi:hypothetical protein
MKTRGDREEARQAYLMMGLLKDSKSVESAAAAEAARALEEAAGSDIGESRPGFALIAGLTVV